MKEWIKWMLLGLLSIAFGAFVLGNSVMASLAITTLTGILFMVAGGFQVYGSLIGPESGGSKVFHVAMGVLMLLLGVSFAFDPLGGMISMALLVLILLAASGITRVILAFQMRQTQYFWMMLLSGALSVFLAGYIWANFSVIAPKLLGILLGMELLFNGAGLVVLALFVRAARNP